MRRSKRPNASAKVSLAHAGKSSEGHGIGGTGARPGRKRECAPGSQGGRSAVALPGNRSEAIIRSRALVPHEEMVTLSAKTEPRMAQAAGWRAVAAVRDATATARTPALSPTHSGPRPLAWRSRAALRTADRWADVVFALQSRQSAGPASWGRERAMTPRIVQVRIIDVRAGGGPVHPRGCVFVAVGPLVLYVTRQQAATGRGRNSFECMGIIAGSARAGPHHTTPTAPGYPRLEAKL